VHYNDITPVIVYNITGVLTFIFDERVLDLHVSFVVVTSTLTSDDVSLTSGRRSPDETDGAAGSATPSYIY
jgi:hypothetical protein